MVTLCFHCQIVGLIIITDLKLKSRSIFLSIITGNGVREQRFIYIQQLNKKQLHKLSIHTILFFWRLLGLWLHNRCFRLPILFYNILL